MKRFALVLILVVGSNFVCGPVDAHGRRGRCHSPCDSWCQPCNPCIDECGCRPRPPFADPNPGDVYILYYCIPDSEGSNNGHYQPRTSAINSNKTLAHDQLAAFAINVDGFAAGDERPDKNLPAQNRPPQDYLTSGDDACCFCIAKYGSLDGEPCKCVGHGPKKRRPK
jgi:hypothetical protein